MCLKFEMNNAGYGHNPKEYVDYEKGKILHIKFLKRNLKALSYQLFCRWLGHKTRTSIKTLVKYFCKKVNFQKNKPCKTSENLVKIFFWKKHC